MGRLLDKYGIQFWLLTLLVIGSCSMVNAKIIFVDSSGSGNNSGTSWKNAFVDLQLALTSDQLSSGDTIFIAEGIYYPTSGKDQSISFVVDKSIHIYGGFSPKNNVLSIGQRNWKEYPSILSGDINRDGFSDEENAQNVTEVYADATFDGIIFEHGYAKEDISGTSGRGGGMYLKNANANIRNCIFRKNFGYIGGGLYCREANVSFKDCLFHHNVSVDGGSAYCISSRSQSQINNCTIVENQTIGSNLRFSVLVYNAYSTLENCTFWGNSHSDIGCSTGGTFDISNSTLQSNISQSCFEDRGNNTFNESFQFENIYTHQYDLTGSLASQKTIAHSFGKEDGLPDGVLSRICYSHGKLWFVLWSKDDIVFSTVKKKLIIGNFDGSQFLSFPLDIPLEKSDFREIVDFRPLQNNQFFIRTSANVKILFDPLSKDSWLIDLDETSPEKYISSDEYLKQQGILDGIKQSLGDYQIANHKSIASDLTGKHLWVAYPDKILHIQDNNTSIQSAYHGQSFRAIFPLNDTTMLASGHRSDWLAFDRRSLQIQPELEWGPKPSSYSFFAFQRKSEKSYWLDISRRIYEISKTGSTLKHYDSPSSRPINAATAFGDTMLIGNSLGIQVFNLLEKKFKQTLSIDNQYLYYLSYDKDKIFAFTGGGLQIIDLNNGDRQVLDSSNIYLSGLVEADTLWCGTEGGKLIKYDISKSHFEKLGEIEIGSHIFSMTRDGQNRMWIGTSDGIYYQKESGLWDLKSIPKKQLSHHEANRYSIHYDSIYNTMYVGTVEGLNMIRIDQLKEVEPYLIYAESITHFQKDSLLTTYAVNLPSSKIFLPAKQRFFEVTYYGQLNVADEVLRYQYRINNSPWIENGEAQSITLPNMRSGRHNLEIRAVRGVEQYSQNSLIYQLHVDNFFYTKWWFITAIALLIASLIYFWYKRITGENIRLEKEVDARTMELKNDKETIEQQAEKLRSLDQLKNRFFANISHELRTPLTLIKGPLKKTKKKVTLNDEITSSINLALNNVETLQSRIDELLDLSKLENGSLKLKLQATDLIQFIKITTSNFHSLLISKNITYKFENDLAENWITELDKSKFEKIIFNLVHNAIKFTPSGGDLVLAIKEEKDLIRIDVKDTGKGIPSGDIAFIFDRYFQTNETEIPPEGGTGIGLSLVKELTELMGGSIRVKSEEGVGTKFTMMFPFVQSTVGQSGGQSAVGQSAVGQSAVGQSEGQSTVPQSAVRQSSVEQSGIVSKNGTSKVLVVEDHPDLRAHIISLIDPLYEVHEAENGQVAWNMLQDKTQEFDLIISDVMMPEMDGFELLDKVKQTKHLKRLPFCFLTARAGQSDKVAAFRMGVDDYLLKPFDEEELFARIENLLKNASYRKSYEKNESDFDEKLSEEEVTQADNTLITNLQQIALDQLDNPQFSIDFLAEKMDMPRRSFYRFIQKETGLSPNAYIKELKLNQARKLLEEKAVTSIAELSLQMGFQKPKYFSKIFKERFGKVPSEYL